PRDERVGLDGAARHHERAHALAARGIGHADRVGDDDGWMAREHGLALRRRDVRAARLDDVLQATDEVQRAALVETADVARAEVADAVEGPRTILLVVAAHQRRPADADLALVALGQ